MAISLPLDQMTPAEKQEAMEILFQDLYGDEEEEPPVPEWQADILRERAAAVERGDEVSLDWELAKKMIREQAQCE